MKNQTIADRKYWLLVLPVIAFMLACNYAKPQLTPGEIKQVTKSVTLLTANIARDVSAKGPIAWLNYFQDTSNFFMANEGELAFKDHRSAAAFIQDTLVKVVKKINLQWSNMRIDPLTNNIACIGSNFHEDITDASGKTTPYDGYFTATVLLVNDEWKIRDLHWSNKPAK